jgi:hypothetical protein
MSYRLFIKVGQFKKFHYVDATFATLASRDEIMRPSHEGRNFPLREPRFLTGLDQTFQQ